MGTQLSSKPDVFHASLGDDQGVPGGFHFLRYLAYIFLIPLALYPLAFLIVRLPSYEQWAASKWGPALEYAYDEQPKNADVLVFGDSSAFLGIDPRLVNARLGLRTVVLPDTIGSIPVTEDEPLKSYLRHNPPPRLLVFYFSAWNLDFDSTSKAQLFEGEEMMFRHMSRSEIVSFALRHPAEILEFPFRLFSSFGPKMITAAMHHVNRERSTAEALGHVDYVESFPPLQSSCSLPTQYLSQTSTASVENLIRRYSTLQTQVMVYLAPAPECGNSALLTQRSFASADASPPQLLPARFFAGDPYFAHIEPQSVPVVSDLLARALRRRLGETHR